MRLERWHIKQLEILERTTNLSGKVFVEIGGDRDAAVLQYALDKGACQAVGFNPLYRINPSDSRMVLHRSFFDKDSDLLVPDGADVVFGTAVLEHVPDLRGLLLGVHRVLRPGGRGLLHGGPIWTCRQGHHLWVRAGETWYTFNGSMGGENPLKPWEHLYLDEAALAKVLATERNVPLNHVGELLNWIYHEPRINRIGYAEMKQAFVDSPLLVNSVVNGGADVPPRDIAGIIADRHGYTMDELAIYEVSFAFTRR